MTFRALHFIVSPKRRSTRGKKRIKFGQTSKIFSEITMTSAELILHLLVDTSGHVHVLSMLYKGKESTSVGDQNLYHVDKNNNLR